MKNLNGNKDVSFAKNGSFVITETKNTVTNAYLVRVLQMIIKINTEDLKQVKSLLKDYVVIKLDSRELYNSVTINRRKIRLNNIKNYLVKHYNEKVSVESLFNKLKKSRSYTMNRRTFSRDLKELEFQNFVKINLIRDNGLSSEVILL